MINSSNSAQLALALLLLAGSASAAEPAPAAAKPGASSGAEAGAQPMRATLESKLRLLKLLLTQSPAVQRIPQSNSTQAKMKLADAQTLYIKAEAESHAGRVEAAVQLLDASLRQIVAASYLVPDAAQLAAQERRRNTDLLEAIRTFQALHKNLSSRLSARKKQPATVDADIGRIDAMVDQAGVLIASGNQKEASVLLNDAYQIVVLALNNMLMAETIVYDLKFESLAEEFGHELARNLSYEELIPIALAQSNTPRDTASLAERYVHKSRELREAAQKQASGGDYRAAVKTIQDATGHLQRALRIAGVFVPQSPE